MNILEEFPNNPFQPGFPASSNNFKGRSEDINKIIRYLPRVITQGRTEHFFITGKRGMGKTSFIKHVGNIAEEKYDMIPIYINNEGTNTIHELIQKLLDKLFKKFNKETWGQKFVKSFLNYFDEINIADFNFKFKDKPQIVDDVKENFAEFLVDLSNNIGDKNGVFIIIDDINGLSNNSKFVNWYKALFETLDFDNEFVPIAFSLVTYPAKFDQLCEQNPSFPRMFNLINIDKLDDESITEFFIDTFNKLGIQFEDKKYLQDMVYYSCGMPLVMQQIGDSVFWNLEENLINENAVYEGIYNVAFELRNKPLKISLDKIKNPNYKNILLKLGKNEKLMFKKQDINDLLNNNEKRVFDEFINEMLKLNILELVDFCFEKYAFVNIVYYCYFLIMSTFNENF